MSLRYRSKIDLWLAAILVAAAVIEVVAFAVLIQQPDPRARWAASLAVGAIVLMMWCLFGTHYTFGTDELRIRSGPFRWRISLAEMESIRPTRNPLSSPACSLDRLRIEYRRGGRLRAIMISPADKAGFLEALSAAAPQIRIEE